MKTTISTARAEILAMLENRTEIKVHPIFSGAVMSLASDGKITQTFDGTYFIVKKP